MGNDGGTIAKRSDILGLASAEPPAKDAIEDIASASCRCSLSHLPLKDGPIVSDYKGHLFSKEKVLEFLLAKRHRTTPQFKHLRGLGDVRDVTVEFDGTIKCPVTGDSKLQTVFAYSRSCGCVVAHSVLGDAASCPNCTQTVEDGDVVVLNPANLERWAAANRQTYVTTKARGLSHAKKPLRSRKRPHDATTTDPNKKPK